VASLSAVVTELAEVVLALAAELPAQAPARSALVDSATGVSRRAAATLDAVSAADPGHLVVQRLDLVEPDGTVRLVVANKATFPQHVDFGSGVVVSHPRPYTGMLMFNEEGGESGGFVFGGAEGPDGVRRQGGSLTFDQYHQDQVLQLFQDDEGDSRAAGLNVFDRPASTPETDQRTAELAREHGASLQGLMAALVAEGLVGGARRVFLGKREDRSSSLALHDAEGRVRLVAEVRADGGPSLTMFDAAGEVTWRVAGDESSG
jgi:hypothetical protein